MKDARRPWPLRKRRGLAALVACFLLLLGLPDPARSSGEGRLVLAHFYSWFDSNTWTSCDLPDAPVEPYISADRATMERQVSQARSSGIDALIQAWLGPDNPTDQNFRTLLSVAEEAGFRVCVGFETTSPFLGSQSAVRDALAYVLENYAAHPAYLKVDGRPVVFFWRVAALPGASGSVVGDWENIRAQVDPGRSMVWISEGIDLDYLRAFDGHHLYSIGWASDVRSILTDWGGRVRSYSKDLGTHRFWVATVMPGYDDRATGRPDAYVRDRRGGEFYQETWAAAVESQPDWIVITSFNEWLEGSQIEPSAAYGDAYLSLTRDLAAGFKAGEAPPIPQPQAASAPTQTASPTAPASQPPAASPSSTSTPSPSPSPTPTRTPSPTSTPAHTPSPTPAARLQPPSMESVSPSPSSTPSPIAEAPVSTPIGLLGRPLALQAALPACAGSSLGMVIAAAFVAGLLYRNRSAGPR